MFGKEIIISIVLVLGTAVFKSNTQIIPAPLLGLVKELSIMFNSLLFVLAIYIILLTQTDRPNSSDLASSVLHERNLLCRILSFLTSRELFRFYYCQKFLLQTVKQQSDLSGGLLALLKELLNCALSIRKQDAFLVQTHYSLINIFNTTTDLSFKKKIDGILNASSALSLLLHYNSEPNFEEFTIEPLVDFPDAVISSADGLEEFYRRLFLLETAFAYYHGHEDPRLLPQNDVDILALRSASRESLMLMISEHMEMISNVLVFYRHELVKSYLRLAALLSDRKNVTSQFIQFLKLHLARLKFGSENKTRVTVLRFPNSDFCNLIERILLIRIGFFKRINFYLIWFYYYTLQKKDAPITLQNDIDNLQLRLDAAIGYLEDGTLSKQEMYTMVAKRDTANIQHLGLT